MKTLCHCILSFVFMCLFTTLAVADDAKKEKWIQLFNGKNMDGWIPKITGYELNENLGNTFRVQDGLLKVSYDQYKNFDGKFGHLFYKQSFSNYRLRVEYRFVGEQVPGGPGWALRNSGMMLHGQTAESMEKNQKFPVSIEVQLLGGSGSGNSRKPDTSALNRKDLRSNSRISAFGNCPRLFFKTKMRVGK